MFPRDAPRVTDFADLAGPAQSQHKLEEPIMRKNPTTDSDDLSRPLSEPVVLTEEEMMKIAAGLAKTVVGRGCYLCGIGALGPYQAT
jgi:hypothetical protein